MLFASGPAELLAMLKISVQPNMVAAFTRDFLLLFDFPFKIFTLFLSVWVYACVCTYLHTHIYV